MHNRMKPKTKKVYDLKTNYVGTCQACFNAQVIKAVGGRTAHLMAVGGRTAHLMVLHGYERPGYGEILGRCWGVDHPPYELDCELTKRWLARVEARLADREAHLANLQADKVEEFVVHVPDYSQRRGWGEQQPKKAVTLKRGESCKDERHHWVYTFEGARQHAVQATAALIEDLKETVKFLTKRVKEWKFAPEALKDHETVKREEKAVRDEKRLAAGFRRDWKQLWKYVADAVQEHKRIQGYLDDAREQLAWTEEQHRKAYDEANARWGVRDSYTFEKYLADSAERNERMAKSYASDIEKKFAGRAFPSNEERKAARDRAKKGA